MLATFLIAFHTRRIDNLTQTVRFLEKFHFDIIKKSEIVFLCQDQCGVIDNNFANSRMENMRLPCMQKCLMLNYGVKIAQSDKIVILDSDRILPQGYFHDVLSNLEKKHAVTTETMHRLVAPVADIDLIEKNYQYHIEKRTTSNHPYMRNLFAGNVALYKSDYWLAGGMDESYIGYGFEDSDMAQRLIRQGIKGKFRSEIELHLYHEPMTYGDGDQKKMFLNNGIRYCKNWDLPIPPELKKEVNQFVRRFV